jgi:hypothetical protein
MSQHVLFIDTATGAPTTPTCTNGKLDVNATVSPPEGGATEAKQDTQITKLAEQARIAAFQEQQQRAQRTRIQRGVSFKQASAEFGQR